MPVVFVNKGVIDKKSITAFGVSSKENPGAIGYFGTGLKYAIAILLRLGQKVTIYAGTKSLRFGVKKQKIRVDEFNFVTLNGRCLDFTTEVGKNWQLWMAFRELYCNCMDEKGWAMKVGVVEESVVPREGTTTVVVEGQEFETVWDQKQNIILGTEPLFKYDTLWVHPGQSRYVYYKGIRVSELSSESNYTYNLQGSVELTEDRTLKYFWWLLSMIRQEALRSCDADFIRTVTLAPKDTYETSIVFDTTPGDTFQQVVSQLAKDFEANLNPSAVRCCKDIIHKSLKESKPAVLSEIDKERLAKAVGFLEKIGFKVSNYPIRLSEFLGDCTLGCADTTDHTIYVSREAFIRGTKTLVSVILEEFLHLQYNLVDETRVMQNYLMGLIVSLGEQVAGEML
jgi:hypothetical protein